MEATKMEKNSTLLDNYKKYYSSKKYYSKTVNYLIDMIENMLDKINPNDLEFLENKKSLSNETNAYAILTKIYDKYRYKLFDLKLNYQIENYLKDKTLEKDSTFNHKREDISRMMMCCLVDPDFLHTNLTFLEEFIDDNNDYDSNDD